MANEEDNWLEDAFNDQKAQEEMNAGMATSTKVAVGIGCIVVVVLIGVSLFAGMGLLSTLASAA